LLESVIEGLVADAGQTEQIEAQRAAALADLGRLENELKKLADAVASGAAVETLLGAIKSREQERRDLKAKLEHLDGLGKAANQFDRDSYGAELRSVLSDWHRMLAATPAGGRQILRMVLAGPISVTKREDGWAFEGQGSYGSLLRGAFYHVRVPVAEVDALNAMADEMNAEAAEGLPAGSPVQQGCSYRRACPLPGTHSFDGRLARARRATRLPSITGLSRAALAAPTAARC
jgi:hypothetical protein